MAGPDGLPPTVQAEAEFTHNSIRHYGQALGEPRTDSLSHADVYAGLQAVIAILAALRRRETTGTGQHIDVAMAATLMAVNERAHVDLNDEDLGAEPAILGATDCPFFIGPGGEHFTVATSLVGSRTFPSYLRAMRRADLADDPRFATAAARRGNFAELHGIVQNWILTFAGTGALDEKLDPPAEPAFQGEYNREVFAELGRRDAEIDRYLASGALVSASLPKAVIANKHQLVSSPATDICRHMEHET